MSMVLSATLGAMNLLVEDGKVEHADRIAAEMVLQAGGGLAGLGAAWELIRGLSDLASEGLLKRPLALLGRWRPFCFWGRELAETLGRGALSVCQCLGFLVLFCGRENPGKRYRAGVLISFRLQ